MKGIPVLMYHALEDEDHPAGAKDPGEQLYVLQVRQFREQMEYLHREGFRTFLLEELLAMDEWPEKAVVLTFDDGHVSNYTLALPILLELGFRAEFFITTGWIGTPQYLNPEQIRGLFDAGMGIGSHGVSHGFFDDMSDIEIERELRQSMGTLIKITGQSVMPFSAPGGRLSNCLQQKARSFGYRCICTSSYGQFLRRYSTYTVPRFAVQIQTSMTAFAAILSGDQRYINRLKLQAQLLCIAKKVLGNKGYEKARAILLRQHCISGH